MRNVPIVPHMLFLALVLTCIAACGNESDAPTESSPEKSNATEIGASAVEGPKVVFLGDSITAGLHLEGGLDEAFPAVLARTMAERGLPFQAVNAGLSGDTSAGGRRRLSWIMKQDPDLLVVELGGNDALRGQDLGEIAGNIEAIVVGATERDCEVLLLGMLIPPSYGEDYSEGFRALFAGIGRRPGVMFVPDFMAGVGGVIELNYRDGLHPNAEGHRKLAQKLEPSMTTWLQRMKSREEATKIDR